jgi:hypothetical protein
MASNEYSDIVLEIVGQIGIIKVGRDVYNPTTHY